ncbi:MAG: tyrosine-type recombinase/integrase [Bryobacterales bacterium]|nr:tyrosine-type recombinase/integrase [Bryobacterales bacterium]
MGINRASFHSLRDTTATWLVMQGADLYVVDQLPGHRNPRMTQRGALDAALYGGAAGSSLLSSSKLWLIQQNSSR